MLDLDLGDHTLGRHFLRDIDKPGQHGQGSIVDGLNNNTDESQFLLDVLLDVTFGIAEVMGMQTVPLLNIIDIKEEVYWYGEALITVHSWLCLTEL